MALLLEEIEAGRRAASLHTLYFAWYARDCALADRALAALPDEVMMYGNAHCLQAYMAGVTARCRGDAAQAVAAFAAARAQPDFAEVQSVLGLIDAGLGREEESWCEGATGGGAAADFPRCGDRADAVYAWTGEIEQALQLLEETAAVPGVTYYGTLRLGPN